MASLAVSWLVGDHTEDPCGCRFAPFSGSCCTWGSKGAFPLGGGQSLLFGGYSVNTLLCVHESGFGNWDMQEVSMALKALYSEGQE